MTNGKQKGKRGELEFAHFLAEHGYPARRGQQFCGSPDSPDVVCTTLPFQVEVKRVERLNMREATAQAKADAGGEPWAVAHRWNQGEWLITLSAADFLRLCKSATPALPG